MVVSRLTALPAIVAAQAPQVSLESVSIVPIQRAVLRNADTSSDVVFVIRDVDVPDQPIQSARVVPGAAGTDPLLATRLPNGRCD